jgi:hypothetical protein
MIEYEDFSLEIGSKQENAYAVKIRSPAGEDRSSLPTPFDLEEWDDILLGLEQTVRDSDEASSCQLRDAARSVTRVQPKEIGNELFRALFSGPVRALYERSLGRIESRRDRGLRIKLHFDLNQRHPDLVQLAGLPWEFLYHAGLRDFLNLNRRTPIVRYLEVPRPTTPLPFRPPLRILVVVSSPTGVEPLDVARERQNIEAAWGQHASVEVMFLEEATKKALRGALLAETYHVLHYMGHGGFDERAGRGGLLFEDQHGNPDAVTGEVLETMLQGTNELRLVLLNACDTARVTRRKGQDPFAGVATALVMGGLPAVVAMQFPISDKAAIVFSEALYSRLAGGDPIDAAVAEARLAIYMADNESLEWGTPVLYMRAPDGRIFDLAGASAIEKGIYAMDPQTTGVIASTAVGVLSSYLAKAGEAAATKVGEDVYQFLKARFSKQPIAQEALSDLEQAPSDADAQVVVRYQLKKLLAEDTAFARDLEALLKRAEESGITPGVEASRRGVAAGRDVSGTVVTGDIGGSVTIGSSSNEES